MTVRFRYALDPVCLLACALYFTNHWFLKPHFSSAFIQGHFSDCLLIPCLVPIILWLHRKLGLREHDDVPTYAEILLHLIVWTIIAESFGPRVLHLGVADAWDVVAYWGGALLSALVWKRSRGLGFHAYAKQAEPPEQFSL